MSALTSNPFVSLQNNIGAPQVIYLADGVAVFPCIGSPEGVIAANAGSLALDVSTGNVYRKTTATVNTGWVNNAAGGSQILAPDGSSSAPGFSFTNETNSGIYRVSAQLLGITVNGNNMIRINNVDPLQINGNSGLTWYSAGFGSAQTALRQIAASQLRLTDGNAANPAFLQSGLVVSNKTTNYTVTSLESDTEYTNAGAAGLVTFTLPTISASNIGMRFKFTVLNTNGITIQAGASTTIQIADSVSGAAGTATSGLVGSTIDLIAVSTTQWIAIAGNGVWAISGADSVGLSYRQPKRLTTQFDAVANTTVASISQLAVNVVAGRGYKFKFAGVTTLNATGGEKYGLGGSATVTNISGRLKSFGTPTGAINIVGTISSLGTGGSIGAAGPTGSIVEIEGAMLCSASGTFGPMFAQSVASGTSSVLVNSSFEVFETQ